MRTFALIASLACVIAATAFNDIVPEEALYESYVPEEDSSLHSEGVNQQHLEFATQTVKAGRSDADCKKAAEDIKKEVDEGVKNDQKVLDDLNDAKCNSEGTNLVKNAEAELAAREKELKDATKAKQDALNTRVSFQALSFSSIQPGACDTQFFGQSTYISATKTVTTTTKHESKKTGEVAVAKTNLVNAKAEASRLQAACRCRMKKAALEAFATLSKKNAARKEAYGRGNMLLCVLAKTNIKDARCTAAGMPELKMPKGVHQDMCVKYVQHAITAKCATSCGHSAATHKGAITCVGLHGKNEPESKCSKIGLKAPAAQTSSCLATKPCTKWATTVAPGCTSSCKSGAYYSYGTAKCVSTKNGSQQADSLCNHAGSKPGRPSRYCAAGPKCGCNGIMCPGTCCVFLWGCSNCCDKCQGGNQHVWPATCGSSRRCT